MSGSCHAGPGDSPAMRGSEPGSTLRIDTLAQGGEGLARPPGSPVVFVPDTAPGDLVRVRIVAGGRDFRRGELLEVLGGGPGRRAAPCPEAGACGGCQWQHLSDAAQDDAARSLLFDALRRIGRLDIDEARVAPTTGLTARLHYRQRARFHLDLAGRPPRLGFLRAGSHDVHPAEQCLVLEPELEALRLSVEQSLPELAATLPGSRVELQVDMPVPDRAAASVDVTRGSASRDGLAAALDLLARIAPALVAVESRRHPGTSLVEYRRGTLEEPGRFSAFLSPGGFMQASREGNRLLTSRVVEAVGSLSLPAGARVLELFAGNGNFSLPLAAMDLDVHACDSDVRAIANARRAATGCAQDLPRAPAFEEADAGILARALAQRGSRFDLVVLDPPRAGARAACEAIASLGARAVVYVSCDAATMARDIGILVRAGFTLEQAQPFAIFPQSSHFETVAVLTR